jgi:dihydroorotase
LAQTTGGYNIDLAHAAEVSTIWHHHNPEKPIIYHVEGDDVGRLMTDLQAVKHGNTMPIHLAHVSSQKELEAKMAAKESGMNITCEATPHHLFLSVDAVQTLGGYGCMKPSLKSEDDRAFLWANMEHIDIFASDCAPHRHSDKEADKPAFGVTNHGVMLPLLLGAVADGRLTMDDIYQKFCVTPRERFNLPLEDGSYVGISTAISHPVERYEAAPYGFSPFGKLEDVPTMVGEVVVAHGGNSTYRANHESQQFVTSYTHLIRPASTS